MFAWRKEHPVARMVDAYVTKTEECLGLFLRAFETYLTLGVSGEFDELVEAEHIAESFCDDLRRDLETALFEKALIPESRGDILKLVEKIDKVPSKADALLHEVQAEMLVMPPALAGKFRETAHFNHETFRLLVQAARALFAETDKVKPLVQQIDKHESACDRIEREAIRAVFSDPDATPLQKVLLKDLAIQLSKISDLSENAADTLTIVTVKRLV